VNFVKQVQADSRD